MTEPQAPVQGAAPDTDPHGLVGLITQLWHQFNERGDPFGLLEVNLDRDAENRPVLVAEALYTGTPFSVEVRTFEDDAHLARYLAACLKYDNWAEKVTRVAPLYRHRQELAKTPETADNVRDVLFRSKLRKRPDGGVYRELRRTATKRPDLVELCAANQGEVDWMVVQLSLLALQKPGSTLLKLHKDLLAAAEKEAAKAAKAETARRPPEKGKGRAPA